MALSVQPVVHHAPPLAANPSYQGVRCTCPADCELDDLVFAGYGMGVDSTALLLRWLLEPKTRPCDLSKLVVIIAQTGDEWPLTGLLVEEYMFPLLASYGVRTIQVARKSASQSDGITILDDTRAPSRCYIEGDYKLSDEMFAAGTIPTTGGSRLCSVKSKGWVLDQLIAMITQGHTYRHAIGFEVTELGRAKRDQGEGGPARQPFYPLIEWGWDRETCEWRIFDEFGVWWSKSACVQCPFALSSKAGLVRTLARFVDDPAEAMKPLLMEHLAVALNPRMGLIGGKRLSAALADAPGGAAVLVMFEDYLSQQPHAVYEVRRVFRARKDDPTKAANVVRGVRQVATGNQAEVQAKLGRLARKLGKSVMVDDGVPRVWLRERGEAYPCPEHMLVVGPALAHDKDNRQLPKAWAMAVANSKPVTPAPVQAMLFDWDSAAA